MGHRGRDDGLDWERGAGRGSEGERVGLEREGIEGERMGKTGRGRE